MDNIITTCTPIQRNKKSDIKTYLFFADAKNCFDKMLIKTIILLIGNML